MGRYTFTQRRVLTLKTKAVKFHRLTYILLLTLLWASCTKDTTDNNDKKTPPQTELDNYLSLKSYAPYGVKLGMAVDCDEYITKGVLYSLANEYFEEVVS